MDQKQANSLVCQILANYAYPVDGTKIAAYSAQLVDFDFEYASEVLLTYCRTKPNPDEPPSSFALRKAIRDAQERDKSEARTKQLTLEEPKLDKTEVKQRLDEILKQTNLI